MCAVCEGNQSTYTTTAGTGLSETTISYQLGSTRVKENRQACQVCDLGLVCTAGSDWLLKNSSWLVCKECKHHFLHVRVSRIKTFSAYGYTPPLYIRVARGCPQPNVWYANDLCGGCDAVKHAREMRESQEERRAQTERILAFRDSSKKRLRKEKELGKKKRSRKKRKLSK